MIKRYLELFWIFFRLGLTSFGGPIAHLGYFRHEFVERRGWLSDRAYADTVALCQFLPGPASSQVGMAVGFYRARYLGAVLAWIGFTLPSAVLLIGLAVGVQHGWLALSAELIHGLKLVAVAVVIQAVWGMATGFCKDRLQVVIAVVVTCVVLLGDGVGVQLAALAASALLAWLYYHRQGNADPSESLEVSPSTVRVPASTLIWLAIFVAGLIALPVWALFVNQPVVDLVDTYYRVGSLVFGGGHVVLPMLHGEVVNAGGVTEEAFLMGYGAAQAVPGPLFTFAGFLGASSGQSLPWLWGSLAVIVIFLPSFLLIFALLPVWSDLSRVDHAVKALRGVHAAVVGLLGAALYDPLWTASVTSHLDVALVLCAVTALRVWKLPVLYVVGVLPIIYMLSGFV